jgi:hypothetical protein
MNTVIRAHIKNDRRLDDLREEIISWNRNKLYKLGDLYIVDDGSPMRHELMDLCRNFEAIYVKADGIPDTKNGLYASLKAQQEFPVFCCVDDAIFGKGILSRLEYFLEQEQSLIPDYGLVGTFACYEDATRNQNKVLGTNLWEIHSSILYALVGHIFSKSFSDIIIKEWEGILRKDIPYPGMCDDIWVATLLKKYGIKAYNTMKDYTQHIGMNNRTFGDNTGSEYVSKMFVGVLDD